MRLSKAIFYWTFLSIIFTSCGVRHHIGQDQYLLRKVKIKESDGDLKGDLQRFIRQEPNKRFAGAFPFKMWIYSYADRGRENRFKWWLKNKLGEPLAIMDSVKYEESRKLMERFLVNKGFFDVQIDIKLKKGKRKAFITYITNKGDPFYINNLRSTTEVYKINKKLDGMLENSLIGPGTRYDIDLFEQERERIVKELKNEGIFQFYKDLIYFELDTSIGNKKMDIDIKLSEIVDDDFLDNFRLNDVFVHPNYSFALMDSSLVMDTLLVKGIKVVTNKPKEYNWKQIEQKILFHNGQKFYFSKYYDRTHKNLADLGIFNYIDVVFKEVPSDTSFRILDCHIHLKSAKQKEMGVEVEGNTGTGLQEGQALGTALKYTYRDKNLFGGAESLSFNLHGGLETQIDKGSEVFNTVNMKAQIGLDFPRIIGPVRQSWFAKHYSPRTIVNLSYDYQFRPHYLKLMTSNISFGYDWNEGNSKQHVLTPVVLNYLQSEYEGDLLDLANQNSQIRNSLENQWVVGSKYMFIHNNQVNRPNRSFGYFKLSLDLSGNSLYGFSKLTGSSSIKILGVDYSQYFKADVDFRRYFNFKRGRFIITRLNIGAGYAYGNSTVMPYIKQFFLGGANSMRAWRARSLGPGSYYDPYLFDSERIIDQTADFKFESNIEGRFNFSRMVKGALFVDAGNIWSLKGNDFREDAELKSNISGLWNDLAVAGGFGLRFDFSFFVIRLDLGLKLKDPALVKHLDNYQIQADGQYPDQAFVGWKPFNVNFAIGYPF